MGFMNMIGLTSQPSETATTNTPVQDAMPEKPETQSISEDQTSPKVVSSNTEKKFPVIELFGPVIQGEGSQAGQQTMFIRFGGCDYRCANCDSMHAVEPTAVKKHAKYMTAHEIACQLMEVHNKTGVRWITFSGGNPCMHKLDELVYLLRTNGFYINVETQGTLWQDWLHEVTMITVSPKSMGMGEKFEVDKYRKFLTKLRTHPIPLCVKVVVFSAQDLEFALHVKGVTKEVFPEPIVTYYLSLGNPFPPKLNDELDPTSQEPIVGLTHALLKSYQTMCEEILPDPRLKEFRFLPQLHVLVYGNEACR